MGLFAQSIHRENDIIISYAVFCIKTKTACCLRKTACKLDVHPLSTLQFILVCGLKCTYNSYYENHG